VLPPSISFLDIQCPNVTFVSPILIGEDISMSRIIALNVANNWAGNLVTCVNYNHLWLNESFSLFIYRKIINRILIHEELAQFVTTTISQQMQRRVKY